MSPLAALILHMSTVYVTRDYGQVYLAHLRRHELGPELRAEQLAEQLVDGAELAGLAHELPLLWALAWDETNGDHRRVSLEDARGEMQLNPASRWGRAWLKACAAAPAQCEALNVRWGAYALRDALEACSGHRGRALGFYRSGKCIEGPKARATLELERWVRWRLGQARSFEEGSRRACAAEERGRHVQGAQQAGLPGGLEGGADFGRPAGRSGARDRERVRGGVRADDGAVQRQPDAGGPQRAAGGRRASRAGRGRRANGKLSSSGRGKGAG